MIGQVLYGINNIYTVEVGGVLKQCRIKGKVLKEDTESYNPIAVGDYVRVENDGWITHREERKSTLQRLNKKKRTPQIIAANVDVVVCVSAVDAPPFRPRFVDRVLVTCAYGNIEPLIVINKCDLDIPGDITDRIGNYRQLGYKVLLTSAANAGGIAELQAELTGKTAVFCGQSGVGKSSLLNSLAPDLNLRIGEISAKYNRGSHTTCYSILVKLNNGLALIDTPGIRELFIYDMAPEQLRFYYVEFPAFAKKCAYPSCLHLDEPDCAVKKAVAKGKIHPDRYESYTRVYQSIIHTEQDDYE